MEPALIYVFDDFDAAQQARGELIQYGFSNDAVELRISDDEAGPVQGNFTVGDACHATPGSDYASTFGTVAHRGNCASHDAASWHCAGVKSWMSYESRPARRGTGVASERHDIV